MPNTDNITLSGGILTQQFIESLRLPTVNNTRLQPESFALSGGQKLTPSRLESDIAGAWELILEHWDSVHSILNELDLPGVRRKLILPLLQLLEFEPQFQRSATRLTLSGGEEVSFVLSHRGWVGTGAPILHTVHPKQKLDDRGDSVRGSKSPHDLLQTFLNLSAEETWGIVTNGVTLRLLRDFHHTYTKGFIEFDLQNIFEERKFSDFLAMYRLCHASRFIPDAEGKTPLDYFYEHCISTGVAVGRDLKANVIHSIECMANGFLQGELIQRLQKDEKECHEFYAEILHVIYRMLFLLFAEQRGMMPGRTTLYAQEYSITSLRERLENGTLPRDDRTDLWEGLKVSFNMLEKGVPALGIFPYNGELFSSDKTHLLNTLTCRNSDLVTAIQHLTIVCKNGVSQRISYADLSVEEIGSIYESLLDYTPRVTSQAETIEKREVFANRFILDPRGSARRESASYYTHPRLVNLVIESALKPVYEDRIRRALGISDDRAISVIALDDKQKEAAEKSILDIKVCDPACGSGAFLIGADNFLGQELAKVRAGDEYPAEAEVRRARRDVLSHCIYGVDLNPMAVELCKVSLWINACVEKFPLNFLDHHIKWGNSLVGVRDPAMLNDGIPNEAFDQVTGDDKATSQKLKKRNKAERTGQKTLFGGVAEPQLTGSAYAEAYGKLDDLAETTPQDTHRKEELYRKSRDGQDWWRDWTAANFWTASFFWFMHRTEDDASVIIAPTNEGLKDYLTIGKIDGRLCGQVNAIGKERRFFHWHLEFPKIFMKGGFDVVLGNPPWDRIKLQEEEHWIDDDYISKAQNKSQRAKRIQEYRDSDDPLKRERVAKFDMAGHDAEAQSKFLRQSGHFPFTARGDINTYTVFAELGRNLLNPLGRAGMIMPTGIVTDDTTKEFFSNLLETHSLAKLVGFENESFIFQDVHHSFKFCAMTMTGGSIDTEEADFIFLCRYFEQVEDQQRHFKLSSEDFAQLNPNTRTCPIFRTKSDAELTKKIYHRVPILINERLEKNPWGVRFLRMIDMANDSSLFMNEPAKGRLPLYEAKLMHQFDHRFSTYQDATQANLNAGILPQTTQEQKQNPSFNVLPRYWVEEDEVILRTSRVPPDLISAYRAKNEKRLGNELVYWMAGYWYNRGNEEMATHIFTKMLSFTSITSALVNIVLCQQLERDFPLTHEDMQNIQKFKGDRSNLFPMAWMLIESKSPKWFIGFRDITTSIAERTAIFSALPRLGVGHTAPVLLPNVNADCHLVACLLANMNSLCFDYITRQKIGGNHLTYSVLNQLPVLARSSYSAEDTVFIVPRVIELIYTASDVKPLADDVWNDGDAELCAAIYERWHENRTATGGIISPTIQNRTTEDGICLDPFIWDDERRAEIRAELDAYYAKLYGLTEQELRYILDPKDVYGKDFPSETFRVLQQRDEQRYGEFKTRTRILEAWHKIHEI